MTSKHKLTLSIASLIIVFALLLYWDSRRDYVSEVKSSFERKEQLVATLTEQSKSLLNKVQNLSAYKSCKYDLDCKVAGLGFKTCNRFHKFLAYSTQRTDEEALFQAIREYNQVQTRLIDLSFKVPSCGVALPAVTCTHETCILK